ncbi:MAG: tetratricopeptide repeat protein, partial [Gammaproteobacteria bacterium]|nr:tetratricopeptide repeat protein [Gammaproteobacteria bacterium]
RYQRAIARLKRNKPAYEAYDEAQKALEKKDLATALRKVEEAIRIEPKEASFYSLRGEIKAARKDTSGARRDLDRAVELNPDYFRPLLLRGIVRRDSGDESGAARDLARSAELLPTAEAYYGLGLVSAKQGARDQAIGYFRKAAVSESKAGQRAGQQLARLDLEANPGRYLSTSLGLTRDGYLVISLNNDTALAVKDIELDIGPRIGNGIRRQGSLRLDRALGGGQKIQLRTDLGPMDVATARNYGVIVSRARLAE